MLVSVLSIIPSLKDFPTVDEYDLAYCESYERLYLIGKVLGESVPLKSISSKMKAEWKTPCEPSFMDLGNDFFLIKFSTLEDCSKVWEDRPFFIQKQVIVLQIWKEEFDPFSETLKLATLWARVIGLPFELREVKTIKQIMDHTGVVLIFDHRNEEIAKDLFIRVCLKVDLSPPVKSEFNKIKDQRLNMLESIMRGLLKAWLWPC